MPVETLRRLISVSLSCHGFSFPYLFDLDCVEPGNILRSLIDCFCVVEHHKKILVDLFHYDSSSTQQQQQLCRASVAPSNERERKKNLITNRSLIISLCSYIYHIYKIHIWDRSKKEGGANFIAYYDREAN